MTSPRDDEPSSDPQVPPADEEAVRRLLGDARASGPVPPAVAERLDRTLADLVAERTSERADGEPVAPVVPLAGRRRRTASLLIAAAAVVLGGVAVGGYLAGDRETRMGTASDAGAERLAEADAPNAASDEDLNPSEARSGGVPAQGSGNTVAKTMTPDRIPDLRSGRLQADVVALRARWLGPAGAESAMTVVRVVPRGFHCAGARYGRGSLIGVTYDGRPAFAAFRAPKGDTQVVEVLQCGTGEVLRSTTIATR